jgi:hypothetical protein
MNTFIAKHGKVIAKTALYAVQYYWLLLGVVYAQKSFVHDSIANALGMLVCATVAALFRELARSVKKA